MTTSEPSRRDDTVAGQAAPPQPQWQNLFVAPAHPEGSAADEQDGAEEQAPSTPLRSRGGRRTHRAA
ncbi:hypothetical protein ACIREE_33755 [Streptomyces sp. NPDC102467]|uniref:hypothetical protein n=1 Tax=Streptomyces sp. NPDC102467 TaxID=3366179 RepID=UPI00381018A5